MKTTEIISRFDEKLRPLMMDISPYLSSLIYSRSRDIFLSLMKSETFEKIDLDSPIVELWNLRFQSPIFNAAGMFKDGRGYEFCSALGAGSFLAGTATREARHGNKKKGVAKPFLSYQRSSAASNWMGLPNEGIEIIADRLSKISKQKNCPVGLSVSANPEHTGDKALNGLIETLAIADKANVDYIELNESCPNVPHECQIAEDGLDTALMLRLERISERFISKLARPLPIIVKFSNDTDVSLVPRLINALIDLGFDGANFGNTSTDYNYCKKFITNKDTAGFDFFINTFGGGVSGSPLREKSLSLSKAASLSLKDKTLAKEFHIIRTGGIANANDIRESSAAGAELNQWFTGFFDNYARIGRNVYKDICKA